MICKKCGREYEDDMLRCLWCDAPNDHHVPPEAPSRQDLSEVLDVQAQIDAAIIRRMDKEIVAEISTEEAEKKIAKHPAGDFMWCAAILGANGLISAIFGALYIAFFHRGEIRKNHAVTKFISIYMSCVSAPFFLIRGLAKMTKEAISIHFHGNLATGLSLVVDVGNDIMFISLCGYIAAFIIKRLTPDYDPSNYKATSRLATLCSVPTIILLFILTPYLFET